MKIRLFNKDSCHTPQEYGLGSTLMAKKRFTRSNLKICQFLNLYHTNCCERYFDLRQWNIWQSHLLMRPMGQKYFSQKNTADTHFYQVSFCLIPLLSEKGVTIRIAPVLQSTIVMIYHFWDPCWWCELMYLMKIGQH